MKLLRNTVILLFIIAAIPAISQKAFDSKRYAEERKEKDVWMKTDEKSPIPQDERSKFKGLNYFPPSRDFVKTAKLIKFKKPETVTLLTSKKEKPRKMLKYAKIVFPHNGKQQVLNVYKNPDLKDAELFIPFTDKTTGKSSYEAGRYIDLQEHSGNDTYVLDFNEAYNPYCNYNKKYSCPLVPLENNLNFEVKAGEKVYKK